MTVEKLSNLKLPFIKNTLKYNLLLVFYIIVLQDLLGQQLLQIQPIQFQQSVFFLQILYILIQGNQFLFEIRDQQYVLVFYLVLFREAFEKGVFESGVIFLGF